MIESIQLDPIIQWRWILPLFLLAIAILGWRESRQSHRFLWGRVFAQMIALIALLGLALRPSYQSNQEKPDVMLLTENFSASTADSLAREEGDMKIVLAPHVAQYAEVEKLRSYHELPGAGRLKYVLGDGIPLEALDIMKDKLFHYYGSPVPGGIVQLNLEKYQANRKNWVRGKVHNMKGGSLRLSGPGGGTDSVKIASTGDIPFELAFFSKQPGRFAYSITTTDSLGRSKTEDFPIEVISERRLAILFLQRYPQAETKFLKNYLSEKGHQTVVRYQVSKSNVRYEFSNGASQKFDRLHSEVLKSFDLMIVDDETYSGLGQTEIEALEDAVVNGLGVLVLFNRPIPAKGFVGNVLGMERDSQAKDTVRYLIPDFGFFTNPYTALRLSHPEKIQPLMASGKQTLAGYFLVGEGKVGFQLLRETYRLSLKGEEGPYAGLWTPVLEQLGRRETADFSASVTTEFPIYPDEPLDFDVLSSNVAPVVLSDGISTSLIEDVTVDEWWHGRTWANNPGWHSLTLQGDTTRVNYFVSRRDSWPSLRRAVQQRNNSFRTRQNNSLEEKENWMIRKEVSPLIFYVAFLLAAGFLWVAPKL